MTHKTGKFCQRDLELFFRNVHIIWLSVGTFLFNFSPVSVLVSSSLRSTAIYLLLKSSNLLSSRIFCCVGYVSYWLHYPKALVSLNNLLRCTGFPKPPVSLWDGVASGMTSLISDSSSEERSTGLKQASESVPESSAVLRAWKVLRMRVQTCPSYCCMLSPLQFTMASLERKRVALHKYTVTVERN